jgi:hypothetical protein
VNKSHVIGILGKMVRMRNRESGLNLVTCLGSEAMDIELIDCVLIYPMGPKEIGGNPIKVPIINAKFREGCDSGGK